jgi:uncharacterized protein
MASTILHMNAANIFVGDEDPTKSLHLVIKNVKLPSLDEMTKEHAGGGAPMKMQLGMGMLESLALTFNLEGFTPDVMTSFMGLGRKKYTIRGNIRDVREHTDTEVKAIVEGRMVKAEMGDFTRDNGIDSSYEIREVAFYSLYFGQQEKLYVDFFGGPNGVRVDGQAIFSRVARNLGRA